MRDEKRARRADRSSRNLRVCKNENCTNAAIREGLCRPCFREDRRVHPNLNNRCCEPNCTRKREHKDGRCSTCNNRYKRRLKAKGEWAGQEAMRRLAERPEAQAEIEAKPPEPEVAAPVPEAPTAPEITAPKGADYYKSPAWRTFAEDYIADCLKDGIKCHHCHVADPEHIHHKMPRERYPAPEKMTRDDGTPLCAPCHAHATLREQEAKRNREKMVKVATEAFRLGGITARAGLGRALEHLVLSPKGRRRIDKDVREALMDMLSSMLPQDENGMTSVDEVLLEGLRNSEAAESEAAREQSC